VKVTDEQLDALRPFLVGERPGGDGEWGMFCPLHADTTRSASLNVNKATWYCQAGCGGGTVEQLVDAQDTFVPADGRVNGNVRRARASVAPTDEVSKARVKGWQAALLDSPVRLEAIMQARGITEETLRDHDIGWDADKRCYSIPIYSNKGEIWNVRRYDLKPRGDRRKMWSVKGMGQPRLYPVQQILDKPDYIIICEGEWDTLLTIQHDFNAITRTGAADVWEDRWTRLFKGMTVYLAHDCDLKGQHANLKIGELLTGVADEIRVLRLPYPIAEKNGKDLTDFWLEHSEHAEAAMRSLMEDAQLFDPKMFEVEDTDASDASVLDSFDSRRVGNPMRLTVTIKGKRDPGFSIPRKVHYQCTMDAGTKCQTCPMLQMAGDANVEIAASDPVVLEMMESSNVQLLDIMRRHYGIPKCQRLEIGVDQHQAVEILYARPSIDHVKSEESADFKNVKITSVGKHDTMANNTVQAVGALHPDPRRQTNEFQAWDVSVMETSLDKYLLDDEDVELLKRFRPRQGQRPLSKLAEIARDMSSHVTKIYGRPELHAAIDLVFHSALSFRFGGQLLERGWLELLVVGDTRTGKSETALKLSRHYGAGELVSCEAASFAGIVGGLQQYGSKEWSVTWGAIPINDRRLVILDEIGGLQSEEIAAMSSVRSSGTAELTKIQSERTYARTRLIWLGNPRNGRMSDYTYGVQAIAPLIGNPEDIARFDMAMSVVADEVPAQAINTIRTVGRMPYSDEICNKLIRWGWSRKSEDIRWVEGAEQEVFEAANELGKRFIEDPPLVQAANIRIKIARMAVALAIRLFSSDENYERVLVRKEHVRDAVRFLERIYSMKNFGYAERSQELIHDRREAEDHAGYIERYLEGNPNLAKFLRSTGSFRRPDLEEIMHIGREEANAIIATLWDRRMIRKDKGDIKVEPTLHRILREIKA
jgi:hypothetical protein